MPREIPICVNNWIFGNAPLREVVERATKMGFDGIELVGEPAIYKPAEINGLVGAYGLNVCSICGMYPGPEEGDLRALCHPDRIEREKAIDYVKACVDLAKKINARSVLVAPSLVGQPGLFVSKADDIQRAVESIHKAAQYAEDQGIMLTIEPINRYEVGLVNSLDDTVAMAKAIGSDFVRIMGDTFHMQIEEGDGIPNALRRAGSYWVQHIHVADNTREAPGMGTMPWREIIRALHDIDYEGVISMEPLPKGKAPYDARNGNIPADKLDMDLKFGLEFLKREQDTVMRYKP
ncbi:sugar phosphate isomerase/epimerase family protein [Mahella australiensis]|uniref:Xylose isomerase domain-containing protein TIM barrel n=1 Tax=Mahella australiensis (strain DSM 15567 / CIP 107919 / 50-1 BON) TaxID=697281 RepID=F3ZVM5_MAHA5|nr:sugar phosphate isomerase/epimerase family protein [Mahella australiensis]AEE96387.1 Xylose isomerase domain-containing protein TIM barrel [Mahella australiensis 50-1 BON]